MQPKLDVVIGMPAFNEETAIESFLVEIVTAFGDVEFRIVVVDDCSADNTKKVIDTAAVHHPVDTYSNKQNSGHGPTTLRALRHAIELTPKYVVATDGDGHISGSTLRSLYEQAVSSHSLTVIEGARPRAGDPWFRKFVTGTTRLLVKYHCGTAPLDANTPFRVYPTEVLRELVGEIPSDHMTPNLVISTLVRNKNLQVVETAVAAHRREGALLHGSTWKQKHRLVPSLRFLQFCVKAASQWLSRRKPDER